MLEIDAEEAQKRLHELLEIVRSGGLVFITEGGRQVAQLVPVARARRPRQAGTAKGMIWIADDFDETPEDFAEYVR